MKIKIKNKIKKLRGIAKKFSKPRDRMVILVLLIGLAGYLVFYQYFNWSALAEEQVPGPAMALDDGLPKIAPAESIMQESGLRCGLDDAGKKDILAGKYSLDQLVIKENIKNLVGDKPMESMIDEIATRNPETASYLVAIAKHESNLGKFSPKKDGKDCFNYWGFRGTYNQTQSGYSCFDTPSQAVDVVGNRIQALTDIENITTPEQMLIWKCGGSCAGHDPADVQRWKDDVDFYFKRINNS